MIIWVHLTLSHPYHTHIILLSLYLSPTTYLFLPLLHVDKYL